MSADIDCSLSHILNHESAYTRGDHTLDLSDTAQAVNMLLLKAGIDGTKKYSPPLGTTNWGTTKFVAWLLGSSPLVARLAF